MLTLKQAVSTLAARLETEAAADAEGERVFSLADGQVLAVRSDPAGEGLLAWTRVAAPAEDDAEKAGGEFLRVRLARLRRDPRIVATRDERGALLLFFRARPDDEREWLERIAALLNESDAVRRHVGTSRADSVPSGGMDLFMNLRVLPGR